MSILEDVLSDQLTNFMSMPPMAIERVVQLPNILAVKESLVITGVRRCGKSFLMKILAQRLKAQAALGYLDLDDPRLIGSDSSVFERAHKLWLKNRGGADRPLLIFLDEPQNIVGWELWVDYFSKQAEHYVVVTGSNSTMLSSDLSTHLTGRHREIYLSPLSFQEVVKAENLKSHTNLERDALLQKTLDTYMAFGGFPRAYLDRDRTILAQYFKDIIYKDIATRRTGASPNSLLELGVTAMSNNTRIVNKTKLSARLGFKQARTITNYLAAFEDCYLLRELKRFDASLKRQQRSLPKFFSIDPAMASAVGFRVLDDKGTSLENLVQLELTRRGYEVFYWTDPKAGWEIDFIARKFGSDTIAVQVCFELENDEVIKRETRGLAALKDQLNISTMTVIVYDRPSRNYPELESLGIHIVGFAEWAVSG